MFYYENEYVRFPHISLNHSPLDVPALTCFFPIKNSVQQSVYRFEGKYQTAHPECACCHTQTRTSSHANTFVATCKSQLLVYA